MKSRVLPALPFVLAAAGLVYALEPSEVPSAPSATPELLVPATAEVRTVTVNATGTATIAESYLRMTTSVTGNAELAEEAVANFAQSRTRTMSGLEGSGLEGLEIVAKGIELDFMPESDNNQNMGFVVASRDGGKPPEPGVTCKEDLEVRFKPAPEAQAQREQIAAAIDTALDLGLELKSKNQTNPYYYNPNEQQDKEGTVDGRLTDEDKAKVELRAQADAMERAKVLAGNLAELSGQRLGQVHSIVLKTLNSKWKGIGQGVEATATLTVKFELVQ